MSLLAAPGEFFAAPAKRSRAGLLREEDAGQRGDMFSAVFAGVCQGLLKELPGLGASAGIRVVWRQRDEFRGRLQENVSQPEAAVRELEPQGASVPAEIPELGRGLKVRTALKDSNVHTLKAQHRNEVQCLIVGQQGKGEIGGGQSRFHILWGLFLRFERVGGLERADDVVLGNAHRVSEGLAPKGLEPGRAGGLLLTPFLDEGARLNRS